MQNPFFLLPYVPKSICSEAPVMDSSAVVNSSNMAASLLPDLCPATWALLLHDLCDDIGPSSLLQRSFPSQSLSWSSRCVLKQHKASANNRNVANLILLFFWFILQCLRLDAQRQVSAWLMCSELSLAGRHHLLLYI